MRKSVWLLSLALLGSFGLSGWLWLELRDARALNLDLAAKLATPVEPAESAPPAATPTPAPVTADRPPALASNTGIATTQTAPRAGGRSRQQEWATYQLSLMRDPRYVEAWKQQWRVNHAPRRENLVRVVGLSPHLADAVLDLQIDRELKQIEVMARDTVETEEEVEARRQADEAEFQASLRKLIGTEPYERLDAYMQSRQSRMQVDRFRTELNAADMLRDDQVEPLITAMHSEQMRFRQELNDYRNAINEPMDADAYQQFQRWELEHTRESNARTLAAASTILSTAQLKELEAMLQRDRDREASEQQMSQLRSKLDSTRASADPN